MRVATGGIRSGSSKPGAAIAAAAPAVGNGNEKLKRRFQLFPSNNPAACFLRRLHLRVFIRCLPFLSASHTSFPLPSFPRYLSALWLTTPFPPLRHRFTTGLLPTAAVSSSSSSASASSSIVGCYLVVTDDGCYPFSSRGILRGQLAIYLIGPGATPRLPRGNQQQPVLSPVERRQALARSILTERDRTTYQRPRLLF